MPLRIIKHRSRGVSYLSHAAGRRGDVRAVLLHQPVRPAGAGLQPDQGRRRLPAVHRRHRPLGPGGLDPARPDRPALHRPALGALLSGAGMLWFTQLTVDSSYWSGLLPGILAMSLGLGLLFIPFTLTATHGVGKDESGIASAVLNTAQQMGGAVGLAALSTVAYGVFRTKIKPELRRDPGAPVPHAIAVASTHGYTVAFVVARDDDPGRRGHHPGRSVDQARGARRPTSRSRRSTPDRAPTGRTPAPRVRPVRRHQGPVRLQPTRCNQRTGAPAPAYRNGSSSSSQALPSRRSTSCSRSRGSPPEACTAERSRSSPTSASPWTPMTV